MTDRDLADRKARELFQELWSRGDYWNFEGSEYELQRLERLFTLVSDRRYKRVLEIGCGAGDFTRLLAGISDEIVAIDIAPAAIERARVRGDEDGTIEYRVANVMDFNVVEEGPWDLVVLTETIYYLGWLYSFFDVAWLSAALFSRTSKGGRLLLSNASGDLNDPLLLPWLIRTYHDLFRNIGYTQETEDVSRGMRNGMEFDLLISLLRKDSDSPPAGFDL